LPNIERTPIVSHTILSIHSIEQNKNETKMNNYLKSPIYFPHYHDCPFIVEFENYFLFFLSQALFIQKFTS